MKYALAFTIPMLALLTLNSCGDSDQPAASGRTVEDHGNYSYETGPDGQVYFNPRIGSDSGSMSGIGNH